MSVSAGGKLGPYEILARIGAGGMGEVWRALDTRLGREVAIKFSAEQFTDRFKREAQAVASLNHPNVCTLHDVGTDYLVMELIEGETLADRIKQGPIPLEEALTIAQQIADALEAAHERSVTHRDLKPGNIKIRPDGTVKVLDFGLAKIGGTPTMQSEDSPTITMNATQEGVILGTAAYMAPEQARGRPVDRRADIWAFGVVLYEMVAGRRLFQGEDLTETLASVVKEQPDLTGVPRKIRRLLETCLQKDPKKRLQAIGDMRLLLQENDALAVAPVAARFRWMLWAVAAVAVIGALAWSFWPKPLPELEAVRFTIDLPSNMKFANPAGTGTPSPDGRMLLISATADNETMPKLWLRRMDSLEVRPLKGTEGGGVLPFWSPDGKSIAFFASGKLKRIEVAGGSAQVLADIGTFEGGTWSPDGVILFSSGGQFHLVAAAGGPLTPLSKGKLAGSLRSPQFLPGGKTFLFHVSGDPVTDNGVYAASLEKPEEATLLVKGASMKAMYAPPYAGRPGYLLSLRDQSLVAQRFDPSTFKLDGDPALIAEDVALNAQLRAGYWISQTGRLAYRIGANGEWQMAWSSRDGKQRDPVGPVGRYDYDYRLSPDGKRVAVSRTVSANDDIWIYDFERGVTNRLTFDAAQEHYPVWSPDGRYVVYTSRRNGKFQLFRKETAGSWQEELLLERSETMWPTDWSGDGKSLLLTTSSRDGAYDIEILPLGEGKPGKPTVFLKTTFREWFGRFSPDGRWIAYSSEESGLFQVYVRASPGGPTGQWQVSEAGGEYPKWSADGREIYFRAGNGIMAAGVRSFATGVEFDTPRVLFLAGPRQFEATPDGKRFLIFMDTLGGGDGDAAGGALQVVTNWQALLK